MDTDGSIKPDGKDIVYYTTSKTLAEDVKELVCSLGGLAVIYERNKIGEISSYTGNDIICRRLNYEVYIKFFTDRINPFYLSRKAERFIPKRTDKYSTKIESIELVGKDITQCITIDHPSHLYITDDFIVTHNSTHDKMAPYMMSYTWNIDKMLGLNAAEELMEKGLIQVIPLAFFRGLSIDSSIVIIDECITGETIIYTEPKNSIENYRGSQSKIRALVKDFNLGKEIKVLSHNDITGEAEYKKVLAARSTGIKKILGIMLQQRSKPIKTTLNHPFALYKEGAIEYVSAGELKVGDRLLLVKDGSNNHTIYNDNNLDILLGFILGDGSLSKNEQATPDIYRLKKQHGLCQLDYCEFSAEILNSKVALTGRSGYTGEVQPVTQTKSLFINPEFITCCFDKAGRKRITEELIEYFSPRTLALWYMDDGSVNIYDEINGNCRFHTESFTYEENEILSSILLERFNIPSNVLDYQKNGHTLYYLTIGKEGTERLHNVIKNYVFDSMQYKLIPEHRGKFDKSLYFTYKNLQNITTKLITEIALLEEEEVFNLEVEDNHNYFANGVLTHNCQNLSTDIFKTIITRIGENCKYIFLGDTEQVDRKKKQESCLQTIINIFSDSNIIKTLEFKDEDCVRNPKIPQILNLLRTNNI